MKKKFLLPISAKGQSLVELAISLVILLYLLSGAVEFGIAFFQYVQLRDAAQEGALYGSLNPADITGITQRTRGSSASPIDLSNTTAVTITISINGTLSSNGGYAALACENGGVSDPTQMHAIQVVVSYDHKIFMPFMPQILNRTVIPL